MCGIVGLVYADQSRVCSPDLVTTMRDVVSYRGPDDAGTYVSGPVGLGHRRLSIIDLGNGHQPMTDEGARTWIVYNGEVYNFARIREELIAKGHTFRTNCDTEVILKLYVDRGERCVDALNGMFAFAIWDADRRTLFLARDRMGVKPLYYAESPDGFVFASEMKSLFASGLVAPRGREAAFAEYLLFRQVAGDDTLFDGVKSLPPGCTMTVRDGRTRIDRYWSPRRSPRENIGLQDAREELTRLLEESVRMRLVSDVPVGTFCSGGVDSSLVTALAARVKTEPVNTFSVGFDEAGWDESEYAEMVSRRYGTVHHLLRVGNVEFDELFPKMVWHNDEPLDFANSVHIFALSRLAKKHVTVVLTGEGSDELFAGYPRYRIPDLVKTYRYMPAPLRRMLADWIPDHRLRKLNRHAAADPCDVLLYNSSYLSPEAVAEACARMLPFRADYRRECLAGSDGLGLDLVGRLSLLDQETFLVSILHRQDKMSMAAGIESRVPFMDYRIVEFANSLPTALKIRSGSGKAIVKDIARERLPSEIVDRRKSGFGVPLAKWFRAADGLGARIAALPENEAAASMFEPTVVRRMVAEHRSGDADHSELLWTMLNLVTWREAFRC